MKNYRHSTSLMIILVISIFTGCIDSNNKNSPEKNLNRFVHTQGRKFLDAEGRHVILHGINLVNKNPEVNYLGNEGPELFAKMKTWGFNCVRLGIIWDGLEPEPGVYDEEYLKGIDLCVKWAGENNLYIFLDMHQDLFSVEFSDGAPKWATLDEDKPHETGDVWSDSYLISPAVQTSFDNFWNNTPAEDGIGIQDHYANAWKHVAQRYAENPMVIGYDIMNEPFPGSRAIEVMPAILQQYGMIVAEETGVIPTEEELMMSWGTVNQRVKILETLTDINKYSRIIQGIGPISQEFEKNQLMAMYNKVAQSIREVDNNHIIFIEHSYFSNMGVESGIEPVRRSDGTIDNLVAYAAHGYDLVVDTKDNSNSSFARVGYIFDQVNKTSDRLNIPTLIGEWGAYGRNAGTLDDGRFVISKFEEHLFGDTYWAYESGIENYEYFSILQRHFPSRISGELLSYSFDHNGHIFNCQWKEDSNIKENTQIYIPDIDLLSEDQITIAPEASKIILNKIPDSQSGYLEIPPTGKTVERTLRFQLTNVE